MLIVNQIVLLIIRIRGITFWVENNFIAQYSFNNEDCLTVHLPHEIKWNANLMNLGNFVDVFLARHVSGTYAHHQGHSMLSCSIWFSAPSFWMGGGLESRCVGRVYGADGAVRPIRTVNTTYAAALKNTTHPKTRCTKPYAATQHLMLLMMAVCTRNMSS